MQRQPDDTTCGPTCLHAIYQFHGDDMPLDAVIEEAPRLEEGGTLAALLGSHAISRGYKVTIHTYNLQVFDPTWFEPGSDPARRQAPGARRAPDGSKAQICGARLHPVPGPRRHAEVRRSHLGSPAALPEARDSAPCGAFFDISFRSPRELPGTNDSDDVRGHPAGHFVVLSGYREVTREVRVSDPWHPNPVSKAGTYWVSMSRLINSILLGILTYDANLVIIEKKSDSTGPRPHGPDGAKNERAHPRRRQ